MLIFVWFLILKPFTIVFLAFGAMALSVGSVSAADLGAPCCGDLEERVAELEATTASKGNPKISLTISGQVYRVVPWWDDGRNLGSCYGPPP